MLLTVATQWQKGAARGPAFSAQRTPLATFEGKRRRPSYDGKEAAALRPGLRPPPRKAEVDGCTQPILIYSALWPPHRPPMHIPAGSRGPGRGRVGVGGLTPAHRPGPQWPRRCTRLITATATIVTHCLQRNDKKSATRSATISAKAFPRNHVVFSCRSFPACLSMVL